jgi:hypothetical protein
MIRSLGFFISVVWIGLMLGCNTVPVSQEPREALIWGRAFPQAPSSGSKGLLQKYPVNMIGTKIVLPESHGKSWLVDFHEGYAMLICNGKTGFVNEKLEVVVPPMFREAEDFSNGKAEVTDAYGEVQELTIHEDGSYVCDPKYKHISRPSPEDFTVAIGLTTNVGRYLNAGLDKGWVVDAHYEFILLNASIEASSPESENDIHSQFYFGAGVGQVIQVQRGWGDQGNSWRLRTNISAPYFLKYPPIENGMFLDTRMAPVLSLTVDYLDGYKRYGVLMGVVW